MSEILNVVEWIGGVILGLMMAKELLTNRKNLLKKRYWIEKSKCVRCQCFWLILLFTCNLSTAITVASFLVVLEFINRNKPTKLN